MKWYAVQEDQDRLVDAYIGLAEAGSTFAANLLRFTPCDLWPYLRGRTLWLVGDSITQVSPSSLQATRMKEHAEVALCMYRNHCSLVCLPTPSCSWQVDADSLVGS